MYTALLEKQRILIDRRADLHKRQWSPLAPMMDALIDSIQKCEITYSKWQAKRASGSPTAPGLQSRPPLPSQSRPGTPPAPATASANATHQQPSTHTPIVKVESPTKKSLPTHAPPPSSAIPPPALNERDPKRARV